MIMRVRLEEGYQISSMQSKSNQTWIFLVQLAEGVLTQLCDQGLGNLQKEFSQIYENQVWYTEKKP